MQTIYNIYIDATTDHITPCSRMRARGNYTLSNRVRAWAATQKRGVAMKMGEVRVMALSPLILKEWGNKPLSSTHSVPFSWPCIVVLMASFSQKRECAYPARESRHSITVTAPYSPNSCVSLYKLPPPPPPVY